MYTVKYHMNSIFLRDPPTHHPSNVMSSTCVCVIATKLVSTTDKYLGIWPPSGG